MEESNQPGQTTTPEGEFSQDRDNNTSAPKQPTEVPKGPAEQPASPKAQTPSAPASDISAKVTVSMTPKQALLLKVLVLLIVVLVIGAAIAAWLVPKDSSDNTVPNDNQYTSYTPPSHDAEIKKDSSDNTVPNDNQYTSYTPPSHDAEIKTDLLALATQLEVYYADFGYYPGGNNAKKCDGSMGSNVSCDLHALLPTRGLDPEAFISPDGKDLNEPGGYIYRSAPDGCAKCEGFELSAFLSDGSVYSKNSLN